MTLFCLITISLSAQTCVLEGGELAGGPFTFCVGDDEADNIADGDITLSGNSGSNSQWVITDDQGIILAFPPTYSIVNFDDATEGTCLVWHLSFEDGLTGATFGNNVSALTGCFSLSNPITVNRSTEPKTGCSITNITATPSACNSDGTYDLTVCFDFLNPLSTDFVATINGASEPAMPYAVLDPLGCFILASYDTGDGSTGVTVNIADSASSAAGGGDPFISEIHYDDASTDSDEQVEITAPAGTNLTGWTLVFYNGSNGTTYGTVNLSGTVADAGNGCGAITVPFVGIQNGSPDGIALVDPAGNVVEFISYEGVVTATNGPASGTMSTDIGVSETGGVEGMSLSLTDAGWQPQGAPSFGIVNTGLSCPTMGITCEGTEITYTEPLCICPISVVAGSVTCDASTIGIDTYTATFTFSGGGQGAGTYTIFSSFGTVVLTNDPNLVATGTITVTGISEGIDVNLTLTDISACSISSMITSPTCDPIAGCSITNITATPSACNLDGTYDLTVCFDIADPLSSDFIATINGIAEPAMPYTGLDPLGCFVLASYANGDGSTGVTVNIADSASSAGGGGDPFISEIHYDDAGGDSDEQVEITAPAGTNLAGWTLVFYNGSNGTTYGTVNLSGTVVDAGNGCGAITVPFVGIQNGAPDGIALVDAAGNVVEFISYEGVVTATNGPASGTMSIDIGVSETGGVEGMSLSLTDAGWQPQGAPSFGMVNAGLSCPTTGATCEGTEISYTEPLCICPLSVVAGSAFCDALTSGTDTYTASFTFSGGGQGAGTYTITASAGTVVLNNDPNLIATGTITVTGIAEGTNVTLTLSDGSACSLTPMLASPTCEPLAVCSITNITATPGACNADQTYDLTICFDVNSPLSTDFIATIGGIDQAAMPYTSLDAMGCFVLAAFANGDSSMGVTVNIADSASSSGGATVFISEIHYDDAGGDMDEQIEITAPAGTDLTGWTLVYYNGSNGTTYSTVNLTGIIGDDGNGCSAISFPLVGIQNGSPDGVALIDPMGNIVEFISYEGVVTATNGPAIGMMSVDIGVAETGAVEGMSLSLTDAGWQPEGAPSFGMINTGLSCPVAGTLCEGTEVTFNEPDCVPPCILPIYEASAVCFDGVNQAGLYEYYVEVTVINAGVAGFPLDVSVDDGSGALTSIATSTNTIFLGPFTHTQTGTGFATITVGDPTGMCFATSFAPEIICGVSVDGDGTSDGTMDDDLHASGPWCDCASATMDDNGGSILAQSDPSMFIGAPTNVQLYVLVDATGMIIAFNNTGLFQGLFDGTYEVYAVNYEVANDASVLGAITIGTTSYLDFMTLITGISCIDICGPASYTLECACFVCPEVNMLASTAPVCLGDCFDLSATMFMDIDAMDNNNQDFMFLFGFYFGDVTATLDDPYNTAPDGLFNGGVSIPADPSGTMAELTCMGATLPAGVYTVVTYFDPSTTSFDPNCTPFASTLIEVFELPTVPVIIEPNIGVCENGDTEIGLVPPSGALPYFEDFDDENGNGVAGICATTDIASCATNVPSPDWTLTGDFSGLFATTDFVQVMGGALVAQDTDFEVCIEFPVTDITGYSAVGFSIDISEIGDHENLDYATVTYIVDGVPTVITNWMGAGSTTATLIGDVALGGAPDDNDWGSTTVSASGIIGSTLQVVVCFVNNAGTEQIVIDNLEITGTACTYNFYSEDPTLNPSAIPVGSGFTFDPMTTPATSPETIWVTCVDENGCEGPPTTAVINVQGDVALACNDNINLSLGSDCSLDFDIDFLLEGNVDLFIYEAVFTDSNGNVLTELTTEDLGETFSYTLTNTCSGNSCWGTITIEDKIEPTADECNCDADSFAAFIADPSNELADWPCVYWCGESNDWFEISNPNNVIPVFGDNCELTPEDQVTQIDLGTRELSCMAFAHSYGWVWSPSNDASHDSEPLLLCEQVILELPIELDSIIFPGTAPDTISLNEVLLSCDEVNGSIDILPPAIIEASVGTANAYPYFLSDGLLIAISPEDVICNLSAVFSDTEFPEDCPFVSKRLRQWEVLDWCSGELLSEHHIIKVEDNTGPVFNTTEITTVIGSIAPWTCTADVIIPELENPPVDACGSAEVFFNVTDVSGNVIAANLSPGSAVRDLVKGTYTVEYLAIDECGNISTTNLESLVIIEDNILPVPVCEDELIVSITAEDFNQGGGTTKILAEHLNQGSYDGGCGEVYFKVIRVDELFGTLNGYWNDLGPNGLPDFNQPPRGLFFPTLPCNGVNGDDFPDVLTIDDKFNVEFTPTFDQSFFDDQIKFCCADVGTSVPVILRVYDVDPGAGSVDPRRMNSLPSGIPLFDNIIPDLHGRFNDCLVNVTVQSKLQPSIVCPDPITLNCADNFDPDTNELLERASSLNACGSIDIGFDDLSVVDNNCGDGTIFRTWFLDLEDDDDIYDNGAFPAEATYQCQQVITIINTDPFDPATIKFPPHFVDASGNDLQLTLECNESGNGVEQAGGFVGAIDLGPFDCVDIPEMCAPEWTDADCGLVGYTLDTDTVYFDDDACVKILNHWTVIDWCTWIPNSGDDIDTDDYSIDFGVANGFITLDELFEDVEDAAITVDPFTGIGIEDEGDDPNSPNGDVLISYSDWSLGDCTPESCFQGDLYNNEYYSYMDWNWFDAGDVQLVDKDGYYNFTQVIKVINTTAPELANCDEVCLPALEDCSTELVITNSAIDAEGCASEFLSWEIEVFDINWELITSFVLNSSNGEEVSLSAGFVELGVYRVRWLVADGCGNKSECIQNYEVADKKAPTAICVQSLSTAVMDMMGSVTIWASDYNLKSEDNCSAMNDLTYSFSGDEIVSSFTIDCDDLANGVSEVFQLEMWVWDEAGNRDFCFVTLRVDDNLGTCISPEGSIAIVAGELSTEFGEMVDNTIVNITTNHPEYPYEMLTQNDGQYAFTSNPMFYDYQIKAKRDDNYLNGVSTLDLVIIQKHILGLELMSSPYQIIAADINSSESLSAADLVDLRKLILGITTELDNNDSWRFVDADQTFADNLNPWPFTEVLEVDNLIEPMMEENFIGVKIGDVSGNAEANNLMSSEIRSNGSITFLVDEVIYEKGDELEINVSAQDFHNIFGFQNTLVHNGLELKAVEQGAINLTDNNVGVRNELTTLSWNNNSAISSDEVLFTLKFLALESGSLSENLILNSRVTKAEAYQGSELTQKDIALVIKSDNGQVLANSEFELFQNEPNPFKSETIIGFNLPKNGMATLTIYEVNGKVVKSIEDHFNQGYNSISIEGNELNSGGLLYYQLEMGEYTATQKMILIE